MHRAHPSGATDASPPLSFDLAASAGAFRLAVAQPGSVRHLAILGASGAGKSLTLRCLAGLRSGSGQIRLGEEEIGGQPAEERRVGWVPQELALLPHLDVWRQVTFGTHAEPELAAAWLERLELSELRNRLPDQLSGGQRQRVALARALATRPRLLLLDEPFSSLDTPVRDRLRRELRELQRELPVTTVLVTHDPEETALLAEDVVVLSEGRALQSGPRPDVFDRPGSPEVAEVLGIGNLRSGWIQGRGRLYSGGTVLEVSDDSLPDGTEVMWCVRPQHAVLTSGPGYPATITDLVDLGAWREVKVELEGGLPLTLRTPDGRAVVSGESCRVAIAPEHVSMWPRHHQA